MFAKGYGMGMGQEFMMHIMSGNGLVSVGFLLKMEF